MPARKPVAGGEALPRRGIGQRDAADLLQVSVEDAVAVMRAVHHVAALLARQLKLAGLTVLQTNRAAGWHDVFHLHVHLVPRWKGDRLRRPWTPQLADPEDLALIAARLQPQA